MERPDDVATAPLDDQLLRLLVESVVDYAIFVLDRDGNVRTWNTGAKRLKGYEAGEIIGRPWSTFYTAQDRERGLPVQLLERARDEGRVEHEGWRVRRDGSRFWANVTITALHDDDGELVGYAKVTRDRTVDHRVAEARDRAIDQQRRSIEQLEELDSWRRDFVSSVAHDLATPTLAIAGFAELLQSGRVDDAQARQLVDRILSNADVLRRLLAQLRTDALLDSGRLRVAPELLQPDDLVADVVADLAPLLEDRPVSIETDHQLAWADHDGLDRILHNLLANVARHTPPGTPVSIRVHTDADGTVVEVADEGDGIPEDLRARLFDRYERGEGGGTGLGLAIVRQLVELHDGTVAVESTPGEGATFRIALPAAPTG